MAQDGFADFMDVAARGEVHHCVGAKMDSRMQLLEFFVDVRSYGRISDIRIDFAERCHPDRHRLQFGMMDVGGNNHAPARHLIPDQSCGQLFAVSDIFHLFGNNALTRIVHL